jgi:hypothetical protein
MFIGARNNSSNRQQMRLYSLIARNKLSLAQELANSEAWVNGKTGAY